MSWKLTIWLTVGIFLTGFVLVGIGFNNLGAALVLFSFIAIPVLKYLVPRIFKIRYKPHKKVSEQPKEKEVARVEIKEKQVKEKYQKLENILKKCPVCNEGEVNKVRPTGFLSIFGASIICNKCGVKFSAEKQKDNELTYRLLSSKVSKEHKYVNQVLKKSEWERGSSDVDYCLETNSVPHTEIVGLTTLLRDSEKTHHYSSAELFEERAVRTSQRAFGAVRVAKGVYIGGSSGTSKLAYSELTKVDTGTLLLTNKRLIYNGNFKNLEFELKEVSSIEEYKDAVKIAASNRKNIEFFKVAESHKWAVYIKIAFSKYTK